MSGAQYGFSYYSTKRFDWTRPDYSTFSVGYPVLPTRYAPLQQQMRVVVNQEEYTFDDGTDPTLTTKRWATVQPSAVNGGAPAWGVRFTCSAVSPSGFTRFAEIAFFDENGASITPNPDWTDDEQVGNAMDQDETTQHSSSTATDRTFIVEFPRQYNLSAVGWSQPEAGEPNANYISAMKIEINTGTPFQPVWKEIGSVDGLDSTDYPGLSTPFDPLTDVLTIDTPANLLGEVPAPLVVIDPPLENSSDRITMFRETRQDRAWVRPTNVGRAYAPDLRDYWFQLLYIYQEMCELTDIQQWMDLPIAEPQYNPYTAGNQAQFHLAHGVNTVFSWAEVDFLKGIPGGNADLPGQMIVEVGDKTDGTSTIWTELTFQPAPTDETEYSIEVVAETITLGDVENNDIRIRRSTRIDKLWADIGTSPYGWNSLLVGMLQKQMRYLREEGCFLPTFYTGSILDNSIFPRAWNWLVFEGGGGSFTFGGPAWGGSGEVVVFNNDLLLIPPTDYTIVWPEININGGTSDGDEVVIGGGGDYGGYDGPDDSDDGDAPVVEESGAPPVDFPPFDLPVDSPISVEIGAYANAELAAGNWEDAGNAVSFSQGNASGPEFVDNCLRIVVTVIDEDGFDGNPLGAKEVIYINKQCSAVQLYYIATAGDVNGDGTFTAFDEGAPSFGCGLNGWADLPLDLWSSYKATDPIISSSSNPLFQMMDGLFNLNGAIAAGEIDNVPFFNHWQELVGQSNDADAAGVVSESGFTSDQFVQYLDPEQDFNDFDIPPPP